MGIDDLNLDRETYIQYGASPFDFNDRSPKAMAWRNKNLKKRVKAGQRLAAKNRAIFSKLIERKASVSISELPKVFIDSVAWDLNQMGRRTEKSEMSGLVFTYEEFMEWYTFRFGFLGRF